MFDKEVELSEISLSLHVEDALFGRCTYPRFVLAVENIAFVDLLIKVVEDAVEEDLDIGDEDGCLPEEI